MAYVVFADYWRLAVDFPDGNGPLLGRDPLRSGASHACRPPGKTKFLFWLVGLAGCFP